MMRKKRAGKTASSGKSMVRKVGNVVRREAGGTARNIKTSVSKAVAKSSRRVKRAVKEIKAPAAATRQAKQVGEAVGAFLGKTIGRMERIVTAVGKKASKGAAN
jgi:hypothetical protein